MALVQAIESCVEEIMLGHRGEVTLGSDRVLRTGEVQGGDVS